MSARRKTKEAELGAAGFQRRAGAEAVAARARRGLPPPAIAAGTAERSAPRAAVNARAGSGLGRGAPLSAGRGFARCCVLLSAAGGRGFVGSLGRRQTGEGGSQPRTGGEGRDGEEERERGAFKSRNGTGGVAN
jgi:hypothetical protein